MIAEGLPYSISIVPSAIAELKAIRVYYRRQITDAVAEQLSYQPSVETRNRKPLARPDSLSQEPGSLWELRVGEYRVFYDVDEQHRLVTVRAVRQKPYGSTTEDIL